MGIKAVNSELCTGCGTCIDDCPMDVLRMDEEKSIARIAYPGDCVVCYQCEKNCPAGAIILNADVVRSIRFPY